ncbi:MAG: hypothetical protein ABI183_21865 [Polyangiaceae bacterium]
MRNTLIFSLVCGSVVGAFAACGGVDSDLLTSNDGGGTSNDGSTKTDATTRDGSTSGRDSSTTGDGGGGGDSSVPDSGIIHPKKDAGILACGDNGSLNGVGGTPVSCNVSDPTCCATQYPFDTINPVSFACTPNEGACSDVDSGSIPIECRSNDDCPGAAQCCGHEITYTSTGQPITIYESVHCTATCPLFFADAGENDNRLFCNPLATTNVCPVGESCVQSSLLPGFNVCGTP